MFANSPTPFVIPKGKCKSSFITVIITAGIGPYINPASIINTFEKSNFKKSAGVPGKIGISGITQYATYASAVNTAIPATFFAENVLLLILLLVFAKCVGQ